MISWKYYPNNRGLAGGMVLAGIGFGTFVFNYVSKWLINPDSLKADEHGYFPLELAQKVPNMLRTLITIWFIMCIIGICMVFPYEE